MFKTGDIATLKDNTGRRQDVKIIADYKTVDSYFPYEKPHYGIKSFNDLSIYIVPESMLEKDRDQYIKLIEG